MSVSCEQLFGVRDRHYGMQKKKLCSGSSTLRVKVEVFLLVYVYYFGVENYVGGR